MEEQTKKETVTIDLNRENYMDNPDTCPWGSIIKFKIDPIEKILDLKNHNFANTVYKANDVAFVVRSYQNKKDRSLVLYFVLDQAKYIMWCKDPNEEIEVVRKGTIKRKVSMP